MHRVAGQLWMFILGVLCCFYSPGCEMSYEWLVQPQPPGIVPAGHGCGAVAALGRPQTVSTVLRSGLALRTGNFGPVADGSKVSKNPGSKGDQRGVWTRNNKRLV